MWWIFHLLLLVVRFGLGFCAILIRHTRIPFGSHFAASFAARKDPNAHSTQRQTTFLLLEFDATSLAVSELHVLHYVHHQHRFHSQQFPKLKTLNSDKIVTSSVAFQRNAHFWCQLNSMSWLYTFCLDRISKVQMFLDIQFCVAVRSRLTDHKIFAEIIGIRFICFSIIYDVFRMKTNHCFQHLNDCIQSIRINSFRKWFISFGFLTHTS